MHQNNKCDSHKKALWMKLSNKNGSRLRRIGKRFFTAGKWRDKANKYTDFSGLRKQFLIFLSAQNQI